MLVLARRPGQKVVFPGLGITVEILRSNGNVARLGIEAPDDVVVLREEVLEPGPRPAAPVASARCSEWNEKLNTVIVRLQRLQARLAAGSLDDPEQQLHQLLGQLGELESSTADAVASGPAPRVLIVDDQDNERELLATCLRLGGIDVVTAGGGREALELLQTSALPDLVLLDMQMPEVDGPTLLQAIRSDERLQRLRVFAVSGSSRQEFAPLPLDGWFSKPVRVDALLRAVRKELTPSAVS